MADEEQDPFAFIIDDCRYSSSQEELLIRLKFAREGEKFSDDDNSPEMEDSGASRRKLDGTDDIKKIHGSESTAVDADSARANNLGFGGERKLEGGRMKEPEVKKYKVSPLVHCSGEKANGDEEVVVVPDEGEMSGAKKKVEYGGDTEVIDVEQETEKVEYSGDTEVINVEDEKTSRRKNRELPRSMFELVWGVGGEFRNGDVEDVRSKDEEIAINCNVESGVRKIRLEGKFGCKYKGGGEEDTTNRCILDALRLLVSDKLSSDGGNIDVFEIAKRCGMTFPCSRYLIEVEEDV